MVRHSKDFWSTIRWFTPNEWNDDPSKASAALVRQLDQIRNLTCSLDDHPSGVPIHIHVCWANEGHASNSYHYSGQAVDFHFSAGLLPLEELLLILSIPEVGGIGYYPEWHPRPGWHIDRRPYEDPGRLFWVYRSSYGYDYSIGSLARELHLRTNKGYLEDLCCQMKKACL
jgi:hypothetical protein